MAECSSLIRSVESAESYGKPIDRNRVTDIEERSADMAVAKVDGVEVAVGNANC